MSNSFVSLGPYWPYIQQEIVVYLYYKCQKKRRSASYYLSRAAGWAEMGLIFFYTGLVFCLQFLYLGLVWPNINSQYKNMSPFSLYVWLYNDTVESEVYSLRCCFIFLNQVEQEHEQLGSFSCSQVFKDTDFNNPSCKISY